MSLRSGHMELCDRTLFINITRSGDVETWNSYYYGDNNERTDLSGRIVEEGAQGIVFSFTGKEKSQTQPTDGSDHRSMETAK